MNLRIARKVIKRHSDEQVGYREATLVAALRRYRRTDSAKKEIRFLRRLADAWMLEEYGVHVEVFDGSSERRRPSCKRPRVEFV